MNNIPLICYTIRQAKQSKHIQRVIVSTDDEEIANVALSEGAEVPFIRPEAISRDRSTDLECFKHAIQCCGSPTWWVHLRCTYPTRRTEDIDLAYEMVKNSSFTSLRSVVELDFPIQKTYYVQGDKCIPTFSSYNGINEPFNGPRQQLPKAYIHNGCIDIVSSDTIMTHNSMSGSNICAFKMHKNATQDIDTLEQWNEVEKYMSKK